MKFTGVKLKLAHPVAIFEMLICCSRWHCHEPVKIPLWEVWFLCSRIRTQTVLRAYVCFYFTHTQKSNGEREREKGRDREGNEEEGEKSHHGESMSQKSVFRGGVGRGGRPSMVQCGDSFCCPYPHLFSVFGWEFLEDLCISPSFHAPWAPLAVSTF